ncbi:hypothetical protein ES703_103940 [subsurface metagenome]
MRSRLKNMGTSLATLPLMFLIIGIPFVALWFLGDWLFTTSVWWLGIPVRIVQWTLAAMMTGCLVYWIYSFIKGLITGRGIYD